MACFNNITRGSTKAILFCLSIGMFVLPVYSQTVQGIYVYLPMYNGYPNPYFCIFDSIDLEWLRVHMSVYYDSISSAGQVVGPNRTLFKRDSSFTKGCSDCYETILIRNSLGVLSDGCVTDPIPGLARYFNVYEGTIMVSMVDSLILPPSSQAGYARDTTQAYFFRDVDRTIEKYLIGCGIAQNAFNQGDLSLIPDSLKSHAAVRPIMTDRKYAAGRRKIAVFPFTYARGVHFDLLGRLAVTNASLPQNALRYSHVLVSR